MKGRLIVFEGADGSGKATQAALLKEALAARGERVRSVTFPNYESPAAGPVRMYLAGEFGAHPDDVSPYAASTLYAVDRYASYKSDWGAFYEAGGTVVADRYVTSNMVHQMTKLRSAKEKREFLQWLDAFEYGTLELPRPDLVILLDIPRDVSEKLLAARTQTKDRAAQATDIHEADREYLARCYAAYDLLAPHYGWVRIRCTEGDRLLTVEEIHAKVLACVTGKR